VAPSSLLFTCGPHGKPELAGAFTGSGLHFNLAHSAALALVAVTRAGPIGVDVERIRPMPNAGDMVTRFFSKREAAAFQALSEDQKTEAFFRLWTRKEAWLKATGEGIAGSLDRVEVAFLPGEPPRFLSLPGDAQVLANCSLHVLAPAPGFTGALAAVAAITRVTCWRWCATPPVRQTPIAE
jgi:4'-phosphopantetheinyl transferase